MTYLFKNNKKKTIPKANLVFTLSGRNLKLCVCVCDILSPPGGSAPASRFIRSLSHLEYHTHGRTLLHVLSHTLPHYHTHILLHTHTLPRPHSLTHDHTTTHAYSYTHTHYHVHTLSHILSPPGGSPRKPFHQIPFASAESLMAAQKWVPRPSDVIVTTYSKTGTTWCVCACMCACLCLCAFVCVCVCVCVLLFCCLFVCVCLRVLVCICMCVCLFACMCA